MWKNQVKWSSLISHPYPLRHSLSQFHRLSLSVQFSHSLDLSLADERTHASPHKIRTEASLFCSIETTSAWKLLLHVASSMGRSQQTMKPSISMHVSRPHATPPKHPAANRVNALLSCRLPGIPRSPRLQAPAPAVASRLSALPRSATSRVTEALSLCSVHDPLRSSAPTSLAPAKQPRPVNLQPLEPRVLIGNQSVSSTEAAVDGPLH